MAANVEIIIKYKDSTASARQQTAAGLKGIGDAAEGAKGKLNSFGQMAVGALRKVGEMAVSALARAGVALVSFVGDAIKGAGDYEQSMNVFQAQSGATALEMDAVKTKAKELGADLTLPATSAAEAGTAMLELSKAGLSVQESMDAARGTLQLAAAAQIDEATAAEITAGALNTFHLAGKEATRVADMLAAGANASSASMTDLAQGVQQGGFAFYAAGQSVDDLVASVALLTNVGLTGSDAGTALKNAFMRLMNPTKEAAGLMRELGINVYDANGKMLPMREIIGVLDSALSGMTQQQRNAALGTIFLSDGMKAMIPLLDAGVEGYDKMKGAVNRQGAAAEMAGAQMMGLNGAVAGLSSQVETLMLEALEPLLPIMTANIQQMAAFAGSLIGQVGPAVEGGIALVTDIANIVSTAFMPALAGATAAAIALAVANSGQLGIALALVVQRVIIATEALWANAAAAAAAAAPLVVLAAAVGGVVLIWQQFNEQTKNATQQLLDSRQWWADSAAAIQNYGNQSAEAQAKLQPYAETIKSLRVQIQGELEDLNRRMVAGTISQAQYESELAVINQHVGALQQVTTAYGAQEQAILKQQAASMTGTTALAAIAEGERELLQQTTLTIEELEKLAKQLQDVFERGAQAVGAFVQTEVGFLADLEKSHSDSNAKITTEQALAYAQQQSAQRAHLGQMLADYTATQLAMGNVTTEQAGRIMTAIEDQFGVMEDTSSKTFLAMTFHIDSFASSGSSDVGALSGALGQTADDAVAAEQKMTALAKQYTAELVQNFNEGKIDAQELTAALNNIPKRININVHTAYTSTGSQTRSDEMGAGLPGRAAGGPVMAGQPYVVGEQGPEVFVPRQNGTIVPNSQMPAGNTYNLYYTAMGSGAPEEDVRQAMRMQSLLMG